MVSSAADTDTRADERGFGGHIRREVGRDDGRGLVAYAAAHIGVVVIDPPRLSQCENECSRE